MELKCDKCGIIDHVLVDGYDFGDRLLEGVMFKVEDKDGEPNVLGVVENAEAYFSDLNKKRWLKRCQEFCKDLDLANCPKCGNDVDAWVIESDIKQHGTFVKSFSFEEWVRLNNDKM